MIEILGFEVTSGFGAESAYVSGLEVKGRHTASQHTAVANKLHMSPMLCNTSSMILHPRTSAYISQNKNLNLDMADRLIL